MQRPNFYLQHTIDAMNIFRAGMWSMHPSVKIPNLLKVNGNILSVDDIEIQIYNRPIYVFAAGKAAHTMSEAFEEVLGDLIYDGLAITITGTSYRSDRIQSLESSHPLPDQRSLAASIELYRFIKSIPSNAIVFALISGGTSSLVSYPPEHISIDDVAETTNLLLKSGAGIDQINTVRRHLCRLKGGRAAKLLKANQLISLLYSDVPDNNLENIGSGLTVPDPTTFQDALAVCNKFKLTASLPESVRTYLEEGAAGKRNDTPKSYDDFKATHHNYILASSAILADVAALSAKKMGYNAKVHHPAYTDSIRHVASEIAIRAKEYIAKNEGSAALFFHGESTIHVTGSGMGGRNQELALHVALAMEEVTTPWTLMSVGTDGIDGNTEAAGAFAYSGMLQAARHDGYSPEGYLLDNDAYHFFRERDCLILTGPTGNNLTDFQILIIDP